MEIVVSQQQGRVPVTVFHINGDIDTVSFEQLEDQAQQAIQSGTRFLVLDLAKVNYVSSYGVRAINQIFTWLRDQSGGEDDASLSKGLRDGTFKSRHLKLAAPNKQVAKVFSMVSVDMFLDIFPDVSQAVASF